MKITGIRTVLLTGPSTDDPYLRESRKRRSAAYIEILTDTELVGIGETYAGYFIPEAVPPIVDFFAPVLVGQGVENIAELWRRMYQTGNYWCRVGLGVAVINGIEAALWDLKGKMYGVPVYELLGGRKHDALPAYATGGPSNYPLERLAAKIDFYLSLGFRGFKIGAGSHEETSDGPVDFVPASASQAADFEGRKETPVLLSETASDTVQACWDDAGVPQRRVYRVAEAMKLKDFPCEPDKLVSQPPQA